MAIVVTWNVAGRVAAVPQQTAALATQELAVHKLRSRPIKRAAALRVQAQGLQEPPLGLVAMREEPATARGERDCPRRRARPREGVQRGERHPRVLIATPSDPRFDQVRRRGEHQQRMGGAPRRGAKPGKPGRGVLGAAVPQV